MNVAKRFVANLVRERKRAGFSQDAVALGAEVSRTEISQLERGLRIARIDTLAKLAGAIGVRPADLLEGITWTPGTRTQGVFDFPDRGASL